MYNADVGRLVAAAIPVDDSFVKIEENLSTLLSNNTDVVERLYYHSTWDVPDDLEFECHMMVTIMVHPLKKEDVTILNLRDDKFDPRLREDDEPLVKLNLTMISSTCNFELSGNI